MWLAESDLPATLSIMNSNQQHQTIYTPYCYLIGWTKLNKFYYGVRHSKRTDCLYKTGCHPDDLWVKYFTSSKFVKWFRRKHGEPDILQIRRTFETAKDAVKWEERVLKKVLVKNRENFLNKCVSGCIMVNNETRLRVSESRKGIPRSEETKRKISQGLKGLKRSAENIHNMSKAQKGKKLSEETKRKLRELSTGRKLSKEARRKISENNKRRWEKYRLNKLPS